MSGFRETNVLGKYLGVPVTGKAPKKDDYQYILDQVSSKLMAWKANQLSFAGRVTLAKSVIEAVPIYPMMTTSIPKSILENIQKLQRTFIWGESGTERKYHAIGWDMITRPKDMEGLGLRRLSIRNKACILKLGWKMQTGDQDFWCKVLRGKYQRSEDVNGVVAKPSDSSL